MGRQIAIIADWPDELALLRHLEADGGIRIFRRFARSQERLWIDDWQNRPVDDDGYGIWPSRYRWEPTPVRPANPCVAGAGGTWRFGDEATGPVILLSRHMHGPMSPGHLYWPKRLLVPARGPLD